LRGRVCLVTGATQGIGLVTARELARMGADVTIVGRDPARTEAARQAIHSATSRSVDVLLADLSRMAEVRRVAADFRGKHDRLDVLVNNAGAMHTSRKVTAEGLETTFATNHLAYFLLVKLLLPLLEKAGTPERKARIVNVASAAHGRGRLDLDDLQLERHPYGGPMAQYSASKLMNVMFTYELARRLEGKNVTANCLHPGVVNTGFGKNDQGWFKTMIKVASLFLISPEKGAETSIYLATSPEVEGVSGKYFDKSRARNSSRASYDQAAQRRLWDISESLVETKEAAA
jgi:NAD(P)-dependent dehydrogenase (short-subunit alcohol dehydrogenase family)